MKSFLFLTLILLTAACHKEEPQPPYPYLPNLVITKLTYQNQIGSSYINIGDTLFVTVEIRNFGESVKDYFNVNCKVKNGSLTLKNLNYTFLPYMLSENNQIVSLHFVVDNLESGINRIIIDADSYNYIPELDETDNVQFKDINLSISPPEIEESEIEIIAINN